MLFPTKFQKPNNLNKMLGKTRNNSKKLLKLIKKRKEKDTQTYQQRINSNSYNLNLVFLNLIIFCIILGLFKIIPETLVILNEITKNITDISFQLNKINQDFELLKIKEEVLKAQNLELLKSTENFENPNKNLLNIYSVGCFVFVFCFIGVVWYNNPDLVTSFMSSKPDLPTPPPTLPKVEEVPELSELFNKVEGSINNQIDLTKDVLYSIRKINHILRIPEVFKGYEEIKEE